MAGEGTSSLNVSGNQFVFPNKANPMDPRNLDALERWLNSQVVNQVVGAGVTSAKPVQGGKNKSNGIVTVSGGTSAIASIGWAGYSITSSNAFPFRYSSGSPTNHNVVTCYASVDIQYEYTGSGVAFPHLYELGSDAPYATYGQGEASQLALLSSGDTVTFELGAYNTLASVTTVATANTYAYILRPFMVSVDGTQAAFCSYATSLATQLTTVGTGSLTLPAATSWTTVGTDLSVTVTSGVAVVTYTGSNLLFMIGEGLIAGAGRFVP